MRIKSKYNKIYNKNKQTLKKFELELNLLLFVKDAIMGVAINLFKYLLLLS